MHLPFGHGNTPAGKVGGSCSKPPFPKGASVLSCFLISLYGLGMAMSGDGGKTYEAMWTDLGMNLEKHEQLLNALGKAYGETLLAQKDRPEGMAYLDFVMGEVHGLRIRELVDARKEGRSVFGAFCVFVPEEIILAVEGILVGLCAGAEWGTAEAERLVPRNTCALIKSAVGFTLTEVCPFLKVADSIIGETTCDGKKKAWESLAERLPLYVMELPNTKSDDARTLFHAEIHRFAAHVEAVSGRKLTVEGLKRGITMVNRKRRALIRLGELRCADPSPISGLDALLVEQVSFYDDPTRFTEKIEALCDECEERLEAGAGVGKKGALRILLSGCPMAVPNWKLPAIIEGLGATIVGEESCVGMRGFRNEVDGDADTVAELLDAIAERYLKTDCAIFTPNPERRDHVVEMASAAHADGVIHHALQFCSPYAHEALSLEASLEEDGLPCLRVDSDYGSSDVEALRTRVQAFLEILRDGR